MNFVLTKLKLFSKIQARLNAVTAENLTTLQPGKPVPEHAQVIGEMSPTLKALHWIRVDQANKANQVFAELVVKRSEMDEATFVAAASAYQTQKSEYEFYNNLFWAAFQGEFPKEQNMSYGYGPNFELYKFEDQGSPLAKALRELMLAHLVGGQRPQH